MTKYPIEVEIDEEDLKLVDELNIKDRDGFFRISVDSKRPFGDSGPFEDMCKILDLEIVEGIGGEKVVPKKHEDYLEEKALKLGKVIKVVLRKGRVTGKYIKEDYSSEWEPLEENSSKSEVDNQ